MRTVIDLGELREYARCPERERRRKLDPGRGISLTERQYRKNLRILLVRYYSAMLDDQILTEAELRRIWSTMWDIPIQRIRSFDKSKASFLNALLSDDERMILRGAGILNKLTARTRTINPMIVDEPFTLNCGELTISGRYDLIFQDGQKHLWIVDWSDQSAQYDVGRDISHAVLIEALHQRTGKRAAGVLNDYIITLGDYWQTSERTPLQLREQVAEATNIAKALSLELHWKNRDTHCKACPYMRACLGAKVVQPKKSGTRQRRRSSPPSD